MKTTWNGNVISMDFTEEGHPEVVTLDIDGLMQNVQDAAKRFGIQTVLRNARAQIATDTKEGAEACKRVKARIAVLDAGTWSLERSGVAKVELSEEERLEIIGDVIYNAYRNTGSKADVLKRFNSAAEATQKQILATLKKDIDKALLTALKQRKAAAKGTQNLPQLPSEEAAAE